MSGRGFLDCVVAPVGKDGREFVRAHHYSRGIHNGPTCYGLFRQGALTGVCAFATPCSENVRASVFGPGHEARVTELHRLVLLDEEPANAESWFVSRALRLHKARKPLIWAVLSFADPTEGHVGTIYQALNARYTGSSAPAWFWRDADGRLRHPRQNGRNVTAAEAAGRGWVRTRREGKHRYLWLMADDRRHRRELERRLLLPSLPYPKSGDDPGRTA